MWMRIPKRLRTLCGVAAVALLACVAFLAYRNIAGQPHPGQWNEMPHVPSGCCWGAAVGPDDAMYVLGEEQERGPCRVPLAWRHGRRMGAVCGSGALRGFPGPSVGSGPATLPAVPGSNRCWCRRRIPARIPAKHGHVVVTSRATSPHQLRLRGRQGRRPVRGGRRRPRLDTLSRGPTSMMRRATGGSALPICPRRGAGGGCDGPRRLNLCRWRLGR